MSKSKNHRSNSARANPPPAGKRSWLAWAGLVSVGVLALVVLLVWQFGKNAASDTASAGGTPDLRVDQTNLDFGDVPVSEMVKASFKLSNTGDGALNLTVPPVPEVVEGC